MTNRDQKRQFDEAVRQIERIIGRKLGKDEIQRLHREISHEGYDLEGIVQVGLALFPE